MDDLKTQTASQERKIRRRLLPRIVLLLLIAIGGLYGMSFMASSPEGLGVTNGKLAACPDKPNCVSTQATTESQRMDPVSFEGSADNAAQRIKSAINNSFSRTRLIEEQEDYLRYEFISLIFRFVDDVEFWFDAENKQIHFRSASRVGHSDLGANRGRMSKIIDQFQNEAGGSQ